jgi:hypothetical protein
VRPTGPAATEPSAPRVNLLSSSLSAPRAFITSMIKSVEEPPILEANTPTLNNADRGWRGPSRAASVSAGQVPFPIFGPVQIPEVHQPGWGVLPAGEYVFRVVESGSNRHIVQIFSKDELTVYATILAIPNLRLKATDKTVITFRERPADQPEALRAWFYPGKQWGEEFVYPKAQANRACQIDQHTRPRNAG